MKTLADVVAFITLVLAPGFDTAAAVRRLGPIDRWLGGTAYVRDTDPTLRESAIETVNKAFAGVQTNLREPLMVPWSELKRALGKPQDAASATGFGAAPTYVFHYHVVGGSGVVYITYHGKPTKDIIDEKIAAIGSLTVRPDKALPGVPKAVDW